eukprot:scaffold115013_cov21-Tisochrysis_lutea.AAC.1
MDRQVRQGDVHTPKSLTPDKSASHQITHRCGFAQSCAAPPLQVWPADVHCLPYVLCYSASWARGAIAWEIGESGTASGSKARKSLGGHDGGSFGNSASH